LRISSQVGAGTTVELWLPIAVAQESSQSGPRAQLGATSERPLRVLMVDDDALVSASTEAMLRDLGHDVVAASSGALALEVVRATNALDLVMTDYLMPGMNGAELADQIRRIRPDLPILIVTGYAETLAHDKRAFPFLPKPYTRSDLASWIAKFVSAKMPKNVVSLGSARRG